MAHRDLTARYRERRANLRRRQLRFQLRQLAGGSVALADALLPFQKQSGRGRAMERALLQDAPDFVALRVEELPRPEWTQFAEQVDEAARLLGVKLEYLQLIHTRRLMIRFDDSEEQHDHEIERVTAEIGELFQHADRSLKKITSPFVGGEPSVSTTDRLVRLNTQRAAAARLQELSQKFRARQRDYMERLRLQKFGSEAFGIDDSGARRGALGETAAVQEQQLLAMTWQVETRDAEIQRIARSVGALAAIFKEVAAMVIDQGSLVDRIDYNMEQTASRMRSGLEQLRRAEKLQRNTRPERCILLLVALILLCAALLVLKHS